MRRYSDKRGGLVVEKTDSTPTAQKTANKVHRSFENSNSLVDAGLMMDTMASYQMAIFTNNPTENGGSECVFCGEKTSYDNRHVCVECWKKYKEDIIEGIKGAISDVQISIH